MFDSKFSKFYFAIVNHRLANPANDTVEHHHIIPKSLGGSNDATNIVKLSAREHFICHCLLIRMLSGKNKSKMVYAAHNMMFWKSRDNQREYKVNSKLYHSLKTRVSIIRKRRLTLDERAKYTPERMKNTWAHIWRTYKVTFPDGSIVLVDDLTKWCKQTGYSLTSFRKALKGDGMVMSKYALGNRGSGCKPSKLDGFRIEYV